MPFFVDGVEDDPGDAEGDEEVADGKGNPTRQVGECHPDEGIDEEGVYDAPCRYRLGECDEQEQGNQHPVSPFQSPEAFSLLHPFHPSEPFLQSES